MPNTPSYLELCVKLYIGHENSIKHLPGKYVTSATPVCQCCYSVCKPDIDLAPRGRCLDPHVQVFLLDEHLGQGRYPIHLTLIYYSWL